MKSRGTLLVAVGVLTIALVRHSPRGVDEAVPVVTVGSVDDPLLTPRVCVTNDRLDPVDVWIWSEDSDHGTRLGFVAAVATQTFRLPDGTSAARFAIRPLGSKDRYFTGEFSVDVTTDVHIRIARGLDGSSISVTELAIDGGGGRMVPEGDSPLLPTS